MSSWPCVQEETFVPIKLKHSCESFTTTYSQAKRLRSSQTSKSLDFQPMMTIDENTPLGMGFENLLPLPQIFPSFSSSSGGPPPSPKKHSLRHRRSLSASADKAFVSPNFQLPKNSWYLSTFEVEEKLGSGHYGDVFKCKHKLDGVTYAVKKLKCEYQGNKHRDLLLKEVHALARCDSPYIVRYFNAWEESDRLYIQTEYCEQGNLSQLIGNHFSEKELLRMIKHIAKGLRHIHARDLVHLDIKPDNIFIKHCDSDENVMYKIGDFGLASSSSLKDGFPREGDGKYLAREILQENDTASLKKGDIFSLGATVYELASRKRLVSQGYQYHALRNGEFEKSALYSEDFWSLLALLLNCEPNERPTAHDLLKFPILARR